MDFSRHEVVTVIAAMVLAALAVGCEPLHRDIAHELPADAGVAGDADDVDGDDVNDEECVPGEPCGPCDQGETVCEQDRTVCEGTVNLTDDVNHCGECDNVCEGSVPDAESVCRSGQCVIECIDDDETFCQQAGICVNLQTDDDHCGECDNACPSSSADHQIRCDDGDCVCDDGLEICGGECVDLQTDDNHCGYCYNSCPGPHDCIEGQCQN